MIVETIQDIKKLLLYSTEQRDFIRKLRARRLLPEDFAQPESQRNLIELYRDIFGHGGANDWGEYLICTSCKTTYSIEHVHDISEYVHISELSPHPEQSKCCGVQYEYFHSNENLLIRLRSVINSDDMDAFVLEDTDTHAVVGLIIGGVMGGEEAWHNSIEPKLNLAPDTTIPNVFERVLYLDEIGIIKTYRKGIVPVLLLLHAFFNRMMELNPSVTNILFWTSEASKVFKLIQQLPHTVLLRDQSTPTRVVVVLPAGKTVFRVRLLSFLYT